MRKRIESAIDELWALWHLTEDERLMDNLVAAISDLEDALRNLSEVE